MTTRIRQRFKKKLVHKHVPYGRTYNHTVDGDYDHYTKGHRKSSTTTSKLDAGGKFFNALIERAFPKTSVKASEVEEAGDVV